MARCRFCGKRFESAQGVRGHLRTCEVYRSGQPKAQPNRLAQPIRSEPKAGGVAEGVQDELRAEEARLSLRKIRGEHLRLDEQEAERSRRQREQREAARQQAETEALGRRRAEIEAEDRQRREAAEAELRRRRREIIQRVKDSVVENYTDAFVAVPLDVQAEAREKIEAALSKLPVEELPRSELDTIAEGIWSKLTRPVVVAARRAEEEEADRRKKEWAVVAEKVRDAVEQSARRDKIQELISHGMAYVRRELREEDLDWRERQKIEERIQRHLEKKLTGEESNKEVEDLVDEILDEELGEPED